MTDPQSKTAAADAAAQSPPDASTAAGELQPGDFYLDPDGLMVLTGQFLLRRGFCCRNGCRHCPWGHRGPSLPSLAGTPAEGMP